MFVREYHPGNFTYIVPCACSVIVCCVYSCIKDDWKAEKVGATGVDFNELEDAFREKVCTMYIHVHVHHMHIHTFTCTCTCIYMYYVLASDIYKDPLTFVQICLIEKDDSQMDMERKAVEYLWP